MRQGLGLCIARGADQNLSAFDQPNVPGYGVALLLVAFVRSVWER
jgi:hypothetical protein